eukprot:5746592-Amphidinium_carterae.1
MSQPPRTLRKRHLRAAATVRNAAATCMGIGEHPASCSWEASTLHTLGRNAIRQTPSDRILNAQEPGGDISATPARSAGPNYVLSLRLALIIGLSERSSKCLSLYHFCAAHTTTAQSTYCNRGSQRAKTASASPLCDAKINQLEAVSDKQKVCWLAKQQTCMQCAEALDAVLRRAWSVVPETLKLPVLVRKKATLRTCHRDKM